MHAAQDGPQSLLPALLPTPIQAVTVGPELTTQPPRLHEYIYLQVYIPL